MKKTLLAEAAATLLTTTAYAESHGPALKEAANNAFLALFADYSEEGVRRYIAEDTDPMHPAAKVATSVT